MLQITDLTKKFKKDVVIDDLKLSLEPGVYGLLGPNGAGKTTLIRCLTNLYQYQGEIFFKGENIKKNQVYMQNIGYLPQKFGAYRELTVAENLAYFCQLKKVKKSERQKEIDKVLHLVNLFEQKKQKTKNLSGGMIRRLGIAQGLLGNPDVIIFDEPTAGLDPEERLRFKMMIGKLPKDKIVLISTHIVEDVEALCDQIIILKQGKVRFKGSTKELREVASKKLTSVVKVILKR